MIILAKPDAELSLGLESKPELVLGFRIGDEITALATADAGYLQLYNGDSYV